MSKRLQVLMPETEMLRLKKVASRQDLSVGEWVRRVLKRAADELEVKPAETKMAAVRRAMQYNFPAPDIEQMNREIEEGYLSGLP